MRSFLDKYLKSLSSKEIPYSEYKRIGKSILEKEPQLWIPSWKFLRTKKLEIIVTSYSAIVYEDQNKVILQTGEQSTELNFPDIYEILTYLEQSLKLVQAPVQTFYFALLSYDLYQKPQKEKLDRDFYKLPKYYIILPGNGYLINHTEKTIHQFESGTPPCNLKPADTGQQQNDQSKIRLSETKNDYIEKIHSIRDLITDGEVYQLNYTTRFSANISVSGFEFFRNLYNQNPAPYSFYARLPQVDIISNSPERFLMVAENRVLTEPIKGTIRTDADPAINEDLKNQLAASEKDSAELSMIVDLMRNDLSMVCKAGSVRVEDHKRLDTFQNVHHLVSTISGELDKGNSFIDLIRNTFPGGSITGCPKIAAMDYINQLEQHNRSFYTGSFFMRFPLQDAFDSNILIRTAIKKGREIHFQAGGGIVIDSDAESEYLECHVKADSFFKTLEKINANIYKQ